MASPARTLAASLATLALWAAEPASAASIREEAAEHGWFVPDHAKLQLAGNIGFLSPGLGYAFLDRHLEADVFLGWVPEAIGGTDIMSLTAKVTGYPLTLHLHGVELRPLSVGLQVTYTFGDQYFVQPPSRFPGKYYDFPTALRAGLAAGSAACVQLGTRRVGAYFELVALDVMLKAWADNRETMGPSDVFSLALGLRARI